ncbi:Cthe_2314 family HEPN domain-containing protein [Paenibacillus sp. TRM 82003]|nr:Cthe_2314 family HEPN domain-containing protein [Paenibacillus sp. TRM 82003]
MLRTMFGDSARKDDGRLKDVLTLLDEMADKYERTRGGQDPMPSLRLLTWTRSLASSLDELEQSLYGAERFASLVTSEFVEDMGPDEEANYRLHLYFFKNGFIRVFSVLDKLGSFLNERFDLKTERLKARYSYFTVLRRMRETRQRTELVHRLTDIKTKYREELQELRLMRNHEVHAMNTELLDENGRIRVRPHDRREQIEDLKDNVRTLQGGYEAVCESVFAAFRYCRDHS